MLQLNQKISLKTALFLVSLLLAPNSHAEEWTLKAGTIVQLRSLEGITSKSNQEGDIVHFVVTTDVLDESGKLPLIKAGTSATGIIYETRPGARMMRAGKIKVELVGTTAVNNQTIPLKGFASKEEQSKIDNLLCPSITCAAIKGRNATIGPNQTFNALIPYDVIITIP